MGRTEDTRNRLFDATLELIAERGFSGTTVDEIIEHAGVAKGTVYYHFAGKAELVEALIADRLSPLASRFRTALRSTPDPQAQLQAVVRAELEWIRDNRPFAKLLVTELWREDRVWTQTLRLLRSELLAGVRDAIAEGIARGEFRSDLDADFAASALFGMTVTSALDWLVFRPDEPIENVHSQILRLADAAVQR